MKKDLISIIVPVYNAEKTIQKCVNSIIKQTYSNIEIILINDGSEDNSLLICKELSLNNKNINVIDSINKGVSSARNIGIENATGKYVMFVDSDDYVDSKWCESLYSIVGKNKFCVCNIYCVDYLTNNIYVENNINEKIKKLKINEFYEVYKLKLLNQPYNKIYEKEIIDKYNIRFDENLSLGEDLLFNLDYLQQCNEIEIVNDRTYFYIKGQNDSLCNKFYPNFYEIQTKIYLKMIDVINSIDISDKQVLKDCYTEFLYSLILSMNNILLNKEYSLIIKVKKIKGILKSSVFDSCLENAEQYKFNKIYWNILKAKNLIGILTYYRLCEFKAKLNTNRRIKDEG